MTAADACSDRSSLWVSDEVEDTCDDALREQHMLTAARDDGLTNSYMLKCCYPTCDSLFQQIPIDFVMHVIFNLGPSR